MRSVWVLPCIHCGHPFSKHDTVFRIRRGWRVHLPCLKQTEEGHQFAGCKDCFEKGRDGQVEK